MNELVSAAATIQGAQIQANFALWGAILAAGIGGIALIVSIRYTANFTLKAHKADKLAELKSKTYFDCIAIYAEFSAAAFNITYSGHSVNKGEILSKQRDFLFALNKANFVSNDIARLKIGRFLNLFNEWFFEFNMYLDVSKKSNEEIHADLINSQKIYDVDQIRLNAITSARNKIILLDPEFRKLENIFRADLGIEEANTSGQILQKETQDLAKKHSTFIKKLLSDSING